MVGIKGFVIEELSERLSAGGGEDKGVLYIGCHVLGGRGINRVQHFLGMGKTILTVN